MKALSALAAIAIVGVMTIAGTTLGEDAYEENTAGGGGYFLQADTGHEESDYDALLYKITFGIYLNAQEGYIEESEMAFQARDWGIMIIADTFEFVKTTSNTDYGYPMAHAKGWAHVSGAFSGHYWFHVQIWDGDYSVDEYGVMSETGVDGKMDRIHLKIFDKAPDEGEEQPGDEHLVDSGHGALNWMGKLEGGNIWVAPGEHHEDHDGL